MELRQPPTGSSSAGPDRVVRLMLVLVVIGIVSIAAILLVGKPASISASVDADHVREVASKLKAAGALDQAAVLYERYLETSGAPAEERAKVAYSVGTTFLEQGSLGEALRWFYEAETLGAGPLAGEVDSKIVHTLERMGRFHAAKAALDAGTELVPSQASRSAEDPVVARVGSQEFHRSDVDRALDELPPEIARAFGTPEQKQEFLKKFVADELLWRKASKLEYDTDPEVLRAHASMFKQLVVAKFVERELAATVKIDETDLRNFYQANIERYKRPAGEGEEPVTVSFEEARQVVERDYKLTKIEQAYNETIASELSTEDVEVFPERMVDGS